MLPYSNSSSSLSNHSHSIAFCYPANLMTIYLYIRLSLASRQMTEPQSYMCTNNVANKAMRRNCEISEAPPRNWSVGKIMLGKTEGQGNEDLRLALYTSYRTVSTAIDGDAQQEAYE